MVELEHTRSILSELGLHTASELLDAKLETQYIKCHLSVILKWTLGAELQEKRRHSKNKDLAYERYSNNNSYT